MLSFRKRKAVKAAKDLIFFIMLPEPTVKTEIHTYSLQDVLFANISTLNKLFFARDFKKSIVDSKRSLETLESWQPTFVQHNQYKQKHTFFFSFREKNGKIEKDFTDISQIETASIEAGIEAGLLCELSSDYISFSLAARNNELLEKVYQYVLELVQPLSLNPSDTVDFISWTSYSDYADYKIQRIKAVPWEKIKPNYTTEISAFLDQMNSWKSWPEGGKLALFHGAPGTGKTYTIRALANSWKEWALFHYIKEPEVLFSSSSILQDITDTIHEGLEMNDSEDALKKNHHVLVLEDSGEFISADAKERVGIGLSKFLNLLDGIFGEHLNLSVIVTTNEPLKKLHPAVERPGRCLHTIEFAALTEAESEEWLKSQNKSLENVGRNTIAELYEKLRDTNSHPLPKDIKASSQSEFGFSH